MGNINGIHHLYVIDRGNTATKAALYIDGHMAEITTDIDPHTAVAALQGGTAVKPDAIIYSTVGAGGEKAMEFLHQYASRVVSIKDPITYPITVQAHHRDTMGGDRIAAAAGAYALHAGHDILVVDSGTCVTYDVVTADGLFLGGNIAPGIRLCLEAMHTHTALLPLLPVPDHIDDMLLGDDTASAMLLGVIYGIVGQIESLCMRLSDQPQVVLTGGNAPLIAPLLRVPATVCPHLVTDGLAYVMGRL